MAIRASSGCQVLLSGTSVTMTGEACSQDAGLVYKITNAAHRLIDPAVALVVKENGSSSSQVASVDLLRGRITFSGTPSAPVTVDGAYLPVAGVNYVADFDLNISATLLDTTGFDNSTVTVQRGKQGLLDASGTIEVKQDSFGTIEGSARTPVTDVINGTAVIVKFYRDGTYNFWLRAKLESADGSGAVNDLNKTKISFKLAPTTGTGTHGASQNVNISFGAD